MSSARADRDARETVELLRADAERYLAHDPTNDEAWLTSTLVVEIRR